MTADLYFAKPVPGLTRDLIPSPRRPREPEAPGQARGGYSSNQGSAA